MQSIVVNIDAPIEEHKKYDDSVIDIIEEHIKNDRLEDALELCRMSEYKLRKIINVMQFNNLTNMKLFRQHCYLYLCFVKIFLKLKDPRTGTFYLKFLEHFDEKLLQEESFLKDLSELIIHISKLASNEKDNYPEDIDKYIMMLSRVPHDHNDFMTIFLFKYFLYHNEDRKYAVTELKKSHNPILNIFADLEIHLTDVNKDYAKIDKFVFTYKKTVAQLKRKLFAIFSTTGQLSVPIEMINILPSHMLLSYCNISCKDVFRTIADIYMGIFHPVLNISPIIRRRRDELPPNYKIKIGYMSKFYSIVHSVLRDRAGIIISCPRDRFEEYTLYFDPPSGDNLPQQLFMNSQNRVMLKETFVEIAQQIRELNLDVLVFSEIGMFPMQYFLAMNRLAPIQINTWGHSDTSGIPTVDYFISSKYFETPYEQSQENYSEKLILLEKSISTFYFKLMKQEILEGSVPRDKLCNDIGIPNDCPIIFCLHTEMKFKPPYVQMLNEFLKDKRSGNSIIVLLKSNLVQNIFEKYIDKEVINRVCFVKKLAYHPYISLMKNSVYVLDTFPFGGCNMSFEAFFVGKTVITMPSNNISGRFTYGLYKRMENPIPNASNPNATVRTPDFSDCIIPQEKGLDAYKETMVKLLNNDKLRANIEQNISLNLDKIYENPENISDWYDTIYKLFWDSVPQ